MNRSIVARMLLSLGLLVGLLVPAVPATIAEAATTYKITYSANGGKGAPASQNKKKNVDIKLSATKPTRVAYTFKGWATSASSTYASYGPGAIFKGNYALKLYAVWHLNYVALGDSYSSGEGAKPNQSESQFINDNNFGGSEACHRSPYAYASRLDTDLSLQLKQFRACTGATTKDVISRAQKIEGKTVAKKQLDYVSSSTGLVTLTIGGNDIGFADIVKLCISVDGGCYKDSPTVRDALDKIGSASFSEKLKKTYKAILKKAPNSMLLVVGYPYAGPGKDSSGEFKPICGAMSRSDSNPTTEDDMNRRISAGLYAVIAKLNSAISSAVADTAKSYKYRLKFVSSVSAGNPFKGHELCTSTPYINNVIMWPSDYRQYSIHPNYQGQDAYATILKTFIKANGYAK